MRINRILSSALQGICAGFAPPFSGPCTISQKLGPNVYELIDEEGDIVPRIPTEELKPAFLDKQPNLDGIGMDKLSNPEAEQRYIENEQISPGSQEGNTDQAIMDIVP